MAWRGGQPGGWPRSASRGPKRTASRSATCAVDLYRADPTVFDPDTPLQLREAAPNDTCRVRICGRNLGHEH
eukprot:scaffold771_cov387-Prasinococcus_capsulatus_cf.AAC.10